MPACRRNQDDAFVYNLSRRLATVPRPPRFQAPINTFTLLPAQTLQLARTQDPATQYPPPPSSASQHSHHVNHHCTGSTHQHHGLSTPTCPPTCSLDLPLSPLRVVVRICRYLLAHCPADDTQPCTLPTTPPPIRLTAYRRDTQDRSKHNGAADAHQATFQEQNSNVNFITSPTHLPPRPPSPTHFPPSPFRVPFVPLDAPLPPRLFLPGALFAISCASCAVYVDISAPRPPEASLELCAPFVLFEDIAVVWLRSEYQKSVVDML
jgi:hypothetical protein